MESEAIRKRAETEREKARVLTEDESVAVGHNKPLHARHTRLICQKRIALQKRIMELERKGEYELALEVDGEVNALLKDEEDRCVTPERKRHVLKEWKAVVTLPLTLSLRTQVKSLLNTVPNHTLTLTLALT